MAERPSLPRRVVSVSLADMPCVCQADAQPTLLDITSDAFDDLSSDEIGAAHEDGRLLLNGRQWAGLQSVMSLGDTVELQFFSSGLRLRGGFVANGAVHKASRLRSVAMQLNATTSRFDVDAASAGIRKELYANDPAIGELVERAERRRRRGSFDAASALTEAASLLRIDTAWLVAACGCLLFVALNQVAKEATVFALPSPEADVAAARLLALTIFVLISQALGLEAGTWLRISGERAAASSPPANALDALVSSGNPLVGVPLALLFFAPVLALDAGSGLTLLPIFGTGFPSSIDRGLLTLLVSPLSEEGRWRVIEVWLARQERLCASLMDRRSLPRAAVFFRAWLLTAFERAGGSAFTALIASAGLYGLYAVPLSTVLSGTTGGSGSALLLLYEALGAYLAYLFQRSGGSLLLVTVTHCTFNVAVAVAAEVSTAA